METKTRNLIINIFILISFLIVYAYVVISVTEINNQIKALGCEAFCTCPCNDFMLYNYSLFNDTNAAAIIINRTP